jgi:hypothetical protein
MASSYALYYKPGNVPSEQVLTYYRQLSGVYQNAVVLIDLSIPNTPKPKSIVGIPTLLNNTTQQQWQGSHALSVFQSWVTQSKIQEQSVPTPPAKQQYVPQQQQYQQHQHQQQHHQQQQQQQAAPASASMEAQTMMIGDATRSGSVVSDDLYRSHMPNKAGGVSRSTGKVSESELAQYNMSRGGNGR